MERLVDSVIDYASSGKAYKKDLQANVMNILEIVGVDNLSEALSLFTHTGIIRGTKNIQYVISLDYCLEENDVDLVFNVNTLKEIKTYTLEKGYNESTTAECCRRYVTYILSARREIINELNTLVSQRDIVEEECIGFTNTTCLF